MCCKSRLFFFFRLIPNAFLVAIRGKMLANLSCSLTNMRLQQSFHKNTPLPFHNNWTHPKNCAVVIMMNDSLILLVQMHTILFAKREHFILSNAVCITTTTHHHPHLSRCYLSSLLRWWCTMYILHKFYFSPPYIQITRKEEKRKQYV